LVVGVRMDQPNGLLWRYHSFDHRLDRLLGVGCCAVKPLFWQPSIRRCHTENRAIIVRGPLGYCRCVMFQQPWYIWYGCWANVLPGLGWCHVMGHVGAGRAWSFRGATFRCYGLFEAIFRHCCRALDAEHWNTAACSDADVHPVDLESTVTACFPSRGLWAWTRCRRCTPGQGRKAAKRCSCDQFAMQSALGKTSAAWHALISICISAQGTCPLLPLVILQHLAQSPRSLEHPEDPLRHRARSEAPGRTVLQDAANMWHVESETAPSTIFKMQSLNWRRRMDDNG
jgi:hypothetical protein